MSGRYTTSRYMTIDGALTWYGGYTLRCDQCSSTQGWTLLLTSEPSLEGERAWAQCPDGHRMQHPLVYPEMVNTLASATDTATAAAAMRRIRWRPHYEDIRDLGMEICSTEPAIVAYWPWDHLVTAERRRRWPDLAAAAAR